jgi:uncharacterized protein (TIGR03066 family)
VVGGLPSPHTGKNLMRLLRLCAVAAVALVLPACGSNKPKDMIVGKWEEDKEGKKVTLEFTGDGKWKMTGEGGGVDGTYKFNGDDEIEMVMKLGEKEVPFKKGKVTVTKDEFTLKTTEKGADDKEKTKEEKFKKAK